MNGIHSHSKFVRARPNLVGTSVPYMRKERARMEEKIWQGIMQGKNFFQR